MSALQRVATLVAIVFVIPAGVIIAGVSVHNLARYSASPRSTIDFASMHSKPTA